MTTGTEAATAVADAQATPDVFDTIVNEQIKSESDAKELPKEGDQAETETPKEDLWPKKAVNALSKAKSQIGKERGIRQELERRLAELEAKLAPQPAKAEQPKTSGMPKEEDFVGKPYGEYLDAVAEYKVEQKLNQKLSERDKASAQEQDKQAREERVAVGNQHLDDNGEKAAKDFADFNDVVDKQIKGKFLAPHVIEALQEAENPAYALYALAKEGRIDDLNDLHPSRVGAIIDRMAESAMSKSKPVTKAPTPMKSLTGSSVSAKRLEDASPDELRKWLKS